MFVNATSINWCQGWTWTTGKKTKQTQKTARPERTYSSYCKLLLCQLLVKSFLICLKPVAFYWVLFESKARPPSQHGAVPAADPPDAGSELARAQLEAAQLQQRDEGMHLDSTLTQMYWHVMLVVLPRLLTDWCSCFP